MIARISGVLESAHDGIAALRCGDIVYEIRVPGCDIQRLSIAIGERITFHTLHYLEGSAQGANFVPRLIGFSSATDRAFFEVFTTVKGVGPRKALRALQMPFARIARAIAERDIDLLKSLPDIGKRSAETIVAELDGKVDAFLVDLERDDRAALSEEAIAARSMIEQAVALLTTLGEPRLQATQLCERALTVDPTIDAPEELVAAFYRLRELPVG